MKIITISREFGSGGREIGKRLADELEFAYYDKEIISKIAEKMELDEDYIESRLERNFTINYPYTFRSSFSTEFYGPNQTTQLLVEQHKIIQELAEKDNCVIVGRAADVILEKMRPFNIFVYADLEAKKERCRLRADDDENLSERQLESKIKEIDKARAKTYSIVARYKWGDKRAYDLCINTSGFKIAEIVPQLAEIAKLYFKI